jgi:NAD(P)-dependent dehydrogenase (short-subunit alcohol dehydrogenase family)
MPRVISPLILEITDLLSAHFYLFHMVKDALLASTSPAFKSRVISVASAAHRLGIINFDDRNFENTEYNPQEAYYQSKLANVHFANELDRRYRFQNLHALSVHPGGIITPLVRYLPSTKDLVEANSLISKTLKSPAQGAATTVWAAIAKELEGEGGIYLDEVAQAELTLPDAPYYSGGYSKEAFDPLREKKLWTESLSLTGLNNN